MFMANCTSSAEDIHRADANIKGAPTTFYVSWAELEGSLEGMKGWHAPPPF